jgi:2-dehydro-3-deoxyphosphogluconate aldolase / (4S)-4-hydroxy-2-oxoglutarate aldolase
MKVINEFSMKAFEVMPVIGIMRNLSFETIEKIVPFYQKAGLTSLEITMTSDGAAKIIKNLSAQFPGLNIGAGTVCDLDDLQSALEAGASFIVTPILNKEVISYCVSHTIPVFPGALTPSEIYEAWKLGATAVKIFPAVQFGPTYLKELKGPFSKIKLLPTGGVSLQNIRHFFEEGAMGVGMGSSLFDKDIIAHQDFEGLYIHFKSVFSTVKGILMSSLN